MGMDCERCHQGSVLGPILFLILYQSYCNAYLFADDMKIYIGILKDTYINKLQSCITQSLCGPTIGHLKLNAQKCKIMTMIRAYYRLCLLHLVRN